MNPNLQLVRLDVLPQCRNDDWSGLSVNTQKSSEPRVELELQGLVVQQQQDGAADIFVTWGDWTCLKTSEQDLRKSGLRFTKLYYDSLLYRESF